MTERYVEIFNETLGEAELDAGEYTVLTAGASTQYVIKEFYAVSSPTGTDKNVTATLNGVAIGDWTGGAKGTQIVPANGVLKLSSTSYPPSYTNDRYSIIGQSPYYPTEYNNYEIDGLTAGLSIANPLTASTYAGALTGQLTSIYHNILVRNGVSYYQYYHDGNSVTTLNYWETGASALSLIHNDSYNVVAFDSRQPYYVNSSNELVTHNPTDGEVLLQATLPNTSFTTYSRCNFMRGWYFWMVGTSNTATCYAAQCIANGPTYTFNSLTSITYGAGTKIWVSYDEELDKFYIYRSVDAGTVYKAVLDITKTTMESQALDSATTVTTYASQVTGTLSSKVDYSTTNYNNIKGHSSVGDKFWYTDKASPYDLIECVYPSTETEYWSTPVTPSYGYTYHYDIGYTLSTTEKAAITVTTPPTLTVMATGVELT